MLTSGASSVQRLDPGERRAAHAEQGRIFILALVADEDDAAALRSDLKRSRLENYKIQRCRTLAESANLLKACAFDLAFIDLDEHASPETIARELREAGHPNPVVGLRSRRHTPPLGHPKPNGIDEVLCKEDLSPSLAEHAVRTILERHFIAAEKAHIQQRLRLAMEAGRLGSWTYFPHEELFELDPVSIELLRLPAAPALRSLDDLCRHIYRDDQEALRGAFESSAESRAINLQIRLRSEKVPLPTIEISGAFSTCGSFTRPTLIGTVKAASDSISLSRRIAEANAAIQDAFAARERTLQEAQKKLMALASELEVDQPAAPQNPSAKTDPTAEPKPKCEALAIDSEAAFQQVLKSIAVAKKDPAEQQAFPFAFSEESLAESALPDASKEGFAVAAKRLVAMSRRGYGLDVTLSMSDQTAIELEAEKELLFEVMRELLTNVVKHARATLCIITLFRDEDDWVLQVEDDGVGLTERPKSVTATLNKFGLFRIRTQLALKGGHLDMAGAMPKGLMARARLPVCLREKPTLR